MMTKGMGIALLSAAALLGGAAAQAGELPWTYGQLGYYKTDGTDLLESDAFQVTGSIGFAEKWHAQLTYLNGDVDTDGIEFFDGGEGSTFTGGDFDGYRVVLGAHPQITPNTQLVTDLVYYDINADFDFVDDFTEVRSTRSADTSGYGAGFGLRTSVSDKLELLGQIWWIQSKLDVDGGSDVDGTDFVLEIGGRYNWTQNVSTGLKISLNDTFAGIGTGGSSVVPGLSSGDSALFDVRWSFGGNIF